MADTAPFPLVDVGAWRERVQEELGELDLDAALTTELPGEITVQPLYTAHEESARQPLAEPAGELGWHLTSRLEAPDPATCGALARRALEGGATALWLRLDLAGRAGVDADDLAAAALAGRDGVAAHHLPDLDAALEGVVLDAAPLIADAGANAQPLAAALLALAERRGLERDRLELHFGCDPLAALARDGRVPAGLDDLKGEMAELTAFCAASLPAATAVAVSDLPYHAAGAATHEELGIAAATWIAYLRWQDAEGVEPAVAARHALLRAAVGRDLFLAVAKLRALRLLWTKIAAACGEHDPPAARIHAVTSERPLTRRDPWVNMLRATTQSFAAVTGGADFVTTSAWDRPLGRSDDAALRLARNTQLVLGHESALGAVLDPAGGSHYVEQLTDALARRAWDLVREIEARGGVETVLADDWLAERLAARREERAAAIREGGHDITGVTRFADPDEKPPRRRAVDVESAAERAAERMRHHRAERGAGAAGELAPDRQRLAALVAMAARGATLGEMSLALQRTCCDTITPLPARRDEEALDESIP